VPRGDVETFHEGGAWHNKVEGTGELLGTYPTKAEAQAAGREEARVRKVEQSAATSTGGSGNATPTAMTPATSPAEPPPPTSLSASDQGVPWPDHLVGAPKGGPPLVAVRRYRWTGAVRGQPIFRHQRPGQVIAEGAVGKQGTAFGQSASIRPPRAFEARQRDLPEGVMS